MMLTYHNSHEKISSATLYVPGRSGVNVYIVVVVCVKYKSLNVYKKSYMIQIKNVTVLFNSRRPF